MAKKVRKKKRKRVRKMDWEVHGDTAFSHDRIKHLRTSVMPDEDVEPSIPEAIDPNALVVSTSGPWAFVQFDGSEILVRIDEKLMVGKASVLAPGDKVQVEPEEEQFFIRGLGKRRTKLSRPAVKISRVKEQVFAANIDTLLVVASARQPRFKSGLVDRYLVAAELGGVEAVLCVNKMDLIDHELSELKVYREIDLPVILTSCETGEGIEELREQLTGKLSVMSGHSGAGKSSLLNVLAPDLDLETREVSGYNDKGRHTTTLARMYEIDGGAIRIIDTPGIRRLGLWGISHEELSYYFPEFDALALDCKFRNCTHIHEPNCAVSAAVEAGEIPMRRYGSYLRIRESLEDEARKY